MVSAPIYVEIHASVDGGARATPRGATLVGSVDAGARPTPRGATSVAAAVGTTSPPIPDALGVIANGEARIRACYDKALEADPTLVGRLDAWVHVGDDGAVSSAERISRNGLSGELEACVLTTLRNLRFARPTAPGDAYVFVWMTFSVSGGADPDEAPIVPTKTP
jgi:hypothetical protein